MLRLEWSPPDLDALKQAVEQWGDRIIDTLEEIVRDCSEYGADRMIEILEAASTPTGEARVARGGNGPGRVDSGRMRDAISSQLRRNDDSIEGEWGWLNEVLAYYGYQEDGTDNIAAMGALQGSYTAAREMFIERLQAAGLRVN